MAGQYKPGAEPRGGGGGGTSVSHSAATAFSAVKLSCRAT